MINKKIKLKNLFVNRHRTIHSLFKLNIHKIMKHNTIHTKMSNILKDQRTKKVQVMQVTMPFWLLGEQFGQKKHILRVWSLVDNHLKAFSCFKIFPFFSQQQKRKEKKKTLSGYSVVENNVKNPKGNGSMVRYHLARPLEHSRKGLTLRNFVKFDFRKLLILFNVFQ